MKKRTVLNFCALLLAAVLAVPCALIRRTASNGAELLSQTGGDFTTLYIALCASVLLLCAAAVLLLNRERELPDDAEDLPAPLWYKAARVLAALAFFTAAYFTYTGVYDLSRAITLVQTVFLAACGVTCVFGAAGRRSVEQSRLAGLFPLYYICFFLLIFYRDNANNPRLYSFALEIITLLAVMLALYFTVGMRFERHKPFLRVFSVLLGLFFAAHELLSYAVARDSLAVIPGVSPAMISMLGALFILLAADFVRVPRTPAAEKSSDAPADEIAAENGADGSDA